MARDVVASLAVTLDMYVCRADGSVDYLEKYPIEEFDFDAWVGEIGALVMGSATYVQSVEWGWQWSHLPTMVLATRDDLPVPDGADVRFFDGCTADAVRTIGEATDKRLWVFGGGQVVTKALLGGVVDVLDITVMPEAIGDGIPLFTKPFDGSMTLVETVPYDNGAVRLVYAVD